MSNNYGPRHIVVPNRKFNFDNIPTYVLAVGRQSQGSGAAIGTAFLLDKPGYLATAAHVVGTNDDGLILIINSINLIDDYQVPEPREFSGVPVKIVAHDPFHDIAILYAPEHPNSSWDVKIGSADNISVGSEATMYGFPHLDVGRNVLTRHHATVGAKVLLPSPVGHIKALTLNALTRPGQSGSPIFREKSNEIVGILTGAYKPSIGGTLLIGGMDATSLHQTTHAISAEYLKGMY